MGGNMEMGSLKTTLRINLVEQSYIWDSNMKKERFLQKGIKQPKEVVVFGGDFNDTLEKYTFKDRKWRDQKVHYR